MAAIKDAINDVIEKLSALDVINQDGQTVKLFSRVWNNQTVYNDEGKIESFPMPAAFVEVINPAPFTTIGQGYRAADIVFRIHVAHEFYNLDGTFEQDLGIFDLRDAILAHLSFFTPSGCGPLTATGEEQQYDHKNVYTYIIDFPTHIIDDTARKQYITKDPPTDARFDVATKTQTTQTLYTVQQGKGYSTKYTATADGEYQNLLILDDNGNQIIGANLIHVIKSIKTLTQQQWAWNPSTSTITLLGGISLSQEEELFIIFQQNIY